MSFKRCNFQQKKIKLVCDKNYSNLSNINLRYYLKLQKPTVHRQFVREIS